MSSASLIKAVKAGIGAIALCAVVTFMEGPAQANPYPPEKWTCYRNDTAVVLATDKREAVGMRFLVRKPTASLQADCTIERRKTDVVIGGDDSDQSDLSHFYIALAKSFLVIDDGTGPDRALFIYDVPSGKTLLKTEYSVQGTCEPTSGCESDEFRIGEEGLVFWRGTSEVPSKKNCPDYSSFMKSTGSAAIEEKSLFNFSTKKVEKLKGKRCVIRQ